MNMLGKKTLMLIITATLVACAAQRDAEKDVEDTSLPITTTADLPITPALPETVLREEKTNGQSLADSAQVGAQAGSAERMQRRAANELLHAPAYAPKLDMPASAACCPQPMYQQPTNTERYQHLDRCGHGCVRQRKTLPKRRPAATRRCSASRGND
jgi:hypothetical protein